VIGFIWVTITIPGIFSPETKRLGDWFPALFGLIIAAHFISLIGIWHMKRWGVEVYMINFFLKTLVHFLTGQVTDFFVILGILFSVVFLGFFLAHYRKMDFNL
jgi:hypothetical protein